MRVKASKQKRGQRAAKGRRPFVAKMPLPVPRELLSAGVELDPEFEQQRQAQLETLKAQLTRLIAEGKAETAIDQVLSLVVDLGRENDRLSWRVLQAVRYRYGRRTEQLSREDLQQLFLALGGDGDTAQAPAELTVPAEDPPEQVDAAVTDASSDDAAAEASDSEPATTPKTKKKRKRVRSMRVAPDVERNVTPTTVPAEERVCALCGQQKPVRYQRVGF